MDELKFDEKHIISANRKGKRKKKIKSILRIYRYRKYIKPTIEDLELKLK